MGSITEQSNHICEQRVNQLYLNHTGQKALCQEEQQPEQPGREETESQVAAGHLYFCQKRQESPRSRVNTVLFIHKIKYTWKVDGQTQKYSLTHCEIRQHAVTLLGVGYMIMTNPQKQKQKTSNLTFMRYIPKWKLILCSNFQRSNSP